MKERMDGRVEGGEGEEGLHGGSGEGKASLEDVGKGDRGGDLGGRQPRMD